MSAKPPRDEHGRFVPALCPDPNCGGTLVYERYEPPSWTGGPAHHAWQCDGLTHECDDGDLMACTRGIIGPIVRVEQPSTPEERK
jgi:hypothetical protein